VISVIRGLNAKGITPDVIWDIEPSRTLLESAGARANFRFLRFPVPTLVIDKLPLFIRYFAWIANFINAEDLRGEYDCFFSFHDGFLVPRDMPHVYYCSGPPLTPQIMQPPPGMRGMHVRICRWIYRKFLRQSRPVYDYHPGRNYVINSQFTARLFEQANGRSIPIVNPPLDLSQYSYRPGDWSKRDSILFFSRIVPYKRPYLLLELAARNPGYRYVVMGGVQRHRRKYLEKLQRQAREVAPEVIFLPNASDAQVKEEFSRARFYIFPAVNEHFGMTTPEAIAGGAIPFVHDSGGQREIVPIEQLRFSDGDFHEKFRCMIAASEEQLEAWRTILRAVIEAYDEKHFQQKMLSFLERGA